jgi:hypothetical protein
MVCKTASENHRGLDLAVELSSYCRIKSSGESLRVPELKGNLTLPSFAKLFFKSPASHAFLPGIVVSHRGVIGILLGYVPHVCNLSTPLARIRAGDTAFAEASLSIRRIWVLKLWDLKRALYKLGMRPWCDLRTDNVLINEDWDPVILGFGRNYELPPLCDYPHGSLLGDNERMRKIMSALMVESMFDA